MVSVDHVRRLTPLEYERLFGYPDGWTKASGGRPLSDAARYVKLGNSIVVPVFAWVARRLVDRHGGGVMTMLGDSDGEIVWE